jgi:hypothetical protein
VNGHRDPISDFKNQSIRVEERPDDLLQTIEKLIESQSELFVAKDEDVYNVFRFKKAKKEPLYKIV